MLIPGYIVLNSEVGSKMLFCDFSRGWFFTPNEDLFFSSIKRSMFFHFFVHCKNYRVNSPLQRQIPSPVKSVVRLSGLRTYRREDIWILEKQLLAIRNFHSRPHLDLQNW